MDIEGEWVERKSTEKRSPKRGFGREEMQLDFGHY